MADAASSASDDAAPGPRVAAMSMEALALEIKSGRARILQSECETNRQNHIAMYDTLATPTTVLASIAVGAFLILATIEDRSSGNLQSVAAVLWAVAGVVHSLVALGFVTVLYVLKGGSWRMTFFFMRRTRQHRRVLRFGLYLGIFIECAAVAVTSFIRLSNATAVVISAITLLIVLVSWCLWLDNSAAIRESVRCASLVDDHLERGLSEFGHSGSGVELIDAQRGAHAPQALASTPASSGAKID